MDRGEVRANQAAVGTVALVTGGSGGIGSAICRRLVREGTRVAINYLRDRKRAEALRHELAQSGGDVEVFQGNVGKPAEVEHLAGRVTDHFGSIDILVHCASLGTFSPTTSTRPSHWDLTFAVHTEAFRELARTLSPGMADGGVMLALSSLGACRYTPDYGAVGVAKAALEGLVRYLAVELGPAGIRVNAIRGGPIAGERLQGSPRFDQIEAESRRRPGGRMGTPDEIADVAAFLVGPGARWIQGQVITVDGGFSLW